MKALKRELLTWLKSELAGTAGQRENDAPGGILPSCLVEVGKPAEAKPFAQWTRNPWVRVPALELTRCVTLDRSQVNQPSS